MFISQEEIKFTKINVSTEYGGFSFSVNYGEVIDKVHVLQYCVGNVTRVQLFEEETNQVTIYPTEIHIWLKGGKELKIVKPAKEILQKFNSLPSNGGELETIEANQAFIKFILVSEETEVV